MWRPQEDGPLLCPEILLGIDEVPHETRADIASHLERVAQARGGLLHVCSAFNALYFGYDPDALRYTTEPDPAFFLEVRASGTLPVLPTGAFVRLTRGARELWGEIVAVSGRREGVEQDGWTAAALSGAPAASEVDEQRLTVDTRVFGPLSADEAVELGRWLRPEGPLQRGHLVGAVPSAAADVSSRDQIGSFAAFLAGAGRGLLELGPLPQWLDSGADVDMVARAVRAAILCVADIMAATGTIRMWGDFGRLASAASAFADSAPARQLLAMVSRPAPDGAARYSALWPLLETLAAGYGDDGDGGDGGGPPEPLTGIAEVALVVDANLMLADAVTSRQHGADVDVRVDDRWLEGGVWRSQRLPVPALLSGLDRLTPAGIGFAETETETETETGQGTGTETGQGTGTETGQGTETSAATGVRESPDSRVDVAHIDDELIVFTVALSSADLSAGRLMLTPPIKKLLPPGAMILRLHHDGVSLPDEVAVQRVLPSRSSFVGVTWPRGMYPGLRLTVAAARAGRRLIATSVRFPEPVVVDGFGPVGWECDWELFAQGAKLPVPPRLPVPHERWQPSVPRGSWRPAVAALEHLVIEALRRDGIAGPAGSRALDGRRLTASLFGPDVATPALLWTVIHTCEDMAVLGKLTQMASTEGGPDVFTWWPDTPQAWEARAAAAWGDGTDLLHEAMNRHWVRPRERRLPRGQQASPESQTAYSSWRLAVEGPGADTELPTGTTFVHGHLRGNGPGKPWHRHIANP